MPCDTFVVLPNITENQSVIFGKNADRADSEVQEVIHVSAATHSPGAMVKCTHIEVAQASRTYEVILSKPCWMWGAEMGSNEHGVAIGNEAVWTKEADDDEKKLLGMDLVRLGLERAKTAKEAVEVITSLLEAHGQGGPCFIDPGYVGMTYHNSFLIADPSEAWVLETAGKHWAAEQVTEGVRNISNELSIGSNITMSSAGLQDYAKERRWWDGTSPFSFKQAFSSDTSLFSGNFEHSVRFENGRRLLEENSADGKFNIGHMMSILRNEKADINWTGSGFVTAGSQVSELFTGSQNMLSHHWFTATPNAACSMFKPFVFVPGALGSDLTTGGSDYSHELQKAHARIKPLPGYDVNKQVCKLLPGLEKTFKDKVAGLITKRDEGSMAKLSCLFKDCAESEIKLYDI